MNIEIFHTVTVYLSPFLSSCSFTSSCICFKFAHIWDKQGEEIVSCVMRVICALFCSTTNSRSYILCDNYAVHYAVTLI